MTTASLQGGSFRRKWRARIYFISLCWSTAWSWREQNHERSNPEFVCRKREQSPEPASSSISIRDPHRDPRELSQRYSPHGGKRGYRHRQDRNVFTDSFADA